MSRQEIPGEDSNSTIQSPVISSSTDTNFFDLGLLNQPLARITYRSHQNYRRVPHLFNNDLYPNVEHPSVDPNPNPDPNPVLDPNLIADLVPDPIQIPNQNVMNRTNIKLLYGNNLSTRTALITVGLIFATSIFALIQIYSTFPELTPEEKVHIRIPWNIEHAKNLGIVLDKYKDDNYFDVMLGVCVTYIFLQTFAIPGSLFLSILSGFLFPFPVALALVCCCSAVGASLCYLISQLLGRRLVAHYFPARAHTWSLMVQKHREHLFNYVVFLRITPFLPNWFINLTAPVVGVPVWPFALGTFVGVAPPSFVAIQAGQTLHKMSATDETFSWTSIFWLGVFACVSLVPIFLKNRLKEKFS